MESASEVVARPEMACRFCTQLAKSGVIYDDMRPLMCIVFNPHHKGALV
jgi:hypothetical protein